MRDWRQFVRLRLGRLGLGPQREQEIVAELGGYLDDLYADCLERGLARKAALERGLREVPDWDRLARQIRRAKRGEDDMNERTRNLWLPGFVTLTLSMLLLFILTRAGLRPEALWVGSNQLLLFYVPWLVALPVFGALGAYWSRRAGGGLPARVLAGLFPATALAAIFCLVFPLSFVVDRHVPMALKLTSFGIYLLTWVLIPGVALLLGVLPFLKARPDESTRASA